LVDERAEEALSEIYLRFTGEISAYSDIEYQKKHQVMRDLLGSDVNQLGELFVRVCEDNRRYRDFTRPELIDCLTEVIACLPVYRTYVRPEAEAVSGSDRAYVEAALVEAGRRRPDLDPELLGFLGRLLVLDERGDHAPELVARFQETSGPVTAKGVEDTAFYVYNRLVALNEVGGDPGRFGEPPEQFHVQSLWARERWPQAMLATSTHDTKRSEDVRARLAALSEIPDRWHGALQRWAELNRPHRTDGLPDAGTEYLLYQTLVGAWPIGVERAVAYVIKAAREAKTHTSWIAPVAAYESALESFVAGVLDDGEFLADLESFLPPLIEAGWVNSLAMKLVCLTAPGVPDLYQGSELWDLSLVDPDNRRPVDYAERRRLLRRLEGWGEGAAAAAWTERESGLPKLLVVTRALGLRAERPDAFVDGDYRPLEVVGEMARHALGFLRGGEVAVVVPRLTLVRGGDWAGTICALPAGRWVDRFTGNRCAGGEVPLEELLAGFPVALLVREGGGEAG
ncbi:MAG: malto-oligosyltrehalose synthase, partial [Candidatus Dormibacteraeota bacterium]|nr:malto-oligosyltrehalose synthase [Candidatus Dormibacteraeota bacterium]